jgi:hypothetical protein
MLALTTAIGGLAAAQAFAQQTPAPASAPEAPEKAMSGGHFYPGGGINPDFLDRD